VRTLDRSIAIVSIAIGILLLAASLLGGWGGDDRGMLIFLAIDCIFFSLIAALFPRTNEELNHDARELGKFGLLSVSILGFIAVSGYLLAGTPWPVPEELFVAVVVFGLPAALVLPLVFKRLFGKRREQQTSK
jgi:MFS family permease